MKAALKEPQDSYFSLAPIDFSTVGTSSMELLVDAVA